ncbi:MAG: sulfatase [Myxococcaceae bacterium]|nr:sulfatase [Myxococcaceae bacterium]
MSPRYRFGLVLAAASVLLAYKILTIASLGLLPIALGWQLETTVLLTWWGVFELGRPQHNALLRRTLSSVFYAGFYLLVVVSIAHTFFFESAAERRISLLEVDLRTLGFFFTNILPLRGLLLMIGLLVAMHVLAFPIARVSKTSSWKQRVVAGGVLWLGVASELAVNPRPPSPIADMGSDLWEQLTTPEVVVDRKKPARYQPATLDRSAAKASRAEPRFDKVLVFVMETMTSGVMKQQQKLLSDRAFVHAARAHAHVYERYFATNQDSRTGLLSMLGSRFIPYEAYSEEGRDHYMKLGQKSSLVGTFQKLGYQTAFAVSQQEIELVVGDLPWNAKLHLEEGDAERLARQKFLCFVPYEFEHSCEDRALLPQVLAFIDANPRVFLYQEFIWGHASEYNKASGRTNTEYYSAYLDAVVEHLQQTGALDRTLIVLTSDHGFRDKGLQSDRAMYQIPLLFYATRFTGSTDSRLLSHLDFKDLLLNELLPDMPAPSEEPFVMMIGPTGTSFLSVLTQPGQFVLMKAREGERYLVHADGFPDSGQSRRAAADFLRLFEDYVGYFSSL